MTQEDKKTLAFCICSMFPYGVYVRLNDEDMKIIEAYYYRGEVIFNIAGEKTNIGVEIERIRPYLRPMSSMTEDEKLEYSKTFSSFGNDQGVKLVFPMEKSLIWLIENHLDVFGLIEKGIALEAPDWMYR